MNKKQLRKLYGLLYHLADRLIQQHNPCRHDENGVCKEDRDLGDGCKNGCCSGCRHLSPNGCTVKALSCKIWLCRHVADQNLELSRKLDMLRRIAYKHELFHVRASCKSTLSRAYTTLYQKGNTKQ